MASSVSTAVTLDELVRERLGQTLLDQSART